MVHMANGAKIRNSSTPVRTNRNGETIVCNQYFEQGRVTSEAIKKLYEKLSTKLDQLIKLLQPPAFPGRMRLNIAFNFHDFTDLCYPSQLSNKSEEMAGKRNNDDYGNKNANTLGFMNKKLLCTCITLSGAFRIRKKRDIGYHLHEEAQN